MTTTDQIPPTPLPGTTPAVDAGFRQVKVDAHDHTLFGNDGLTFRDVLDMINPLQHLPVVSTVYRSLVDDELSPGSRMVGGGLFGGFIGLGLAMVNSVIEDLTGKDIGAHVVALFTGPDEPPGNLPNAPGAAPEVMVAAASVSSSPAEEPIPIPPQPITPVLREELLPPPASQPINPLATQAASAARAANQNVTPSLVSHQVPTARPSRDPRDLPPSYNLNTELINLLMFSVPVVVGPGARDAADGNQESSLNPGHDHNPVQTAANLAYLRGQAARSSAITNAGTGAAFVPLAGSGNL